ncbi:ABC transporter substrate-binding protein [Acrocarpospora catenulata]|uniref:ABC transporter substrate-binding protein n=1 Tax=Acrocarpospora catenulata TaxID=2836182 RepID=UPI001BD953DD|nr:ABC transporter substrate-binding protein [Acrocarpospora catenulata]
MPGSWTDNARRLLIPLMVPLMVAALASCGGSPTESPTAQQTPSSPANPHQGGTLRVGITSLSTADALDPAKVSTAGGYAIAGQLYDTLTEYGTDGKVTMRLAESVEPGDTADKWTVTLRDGAVFSDGSPVNAKAVRHTFQRIFDEKLPPSTSMPYVDPAAITVVDDRTLTFTLKEPTVLFPEALTSPTVSIVPEGFTPAKPVGSGPFVLETNKPGTSITFTANTRYWGGKPYAERLELISFEDASAQVNALIGGQIEMASSIDPSLVPVVKAAGDKYVVDSYATSGTLTWQMNVKQKPFNDPVVRQALRLAVNRKELIDQAMAGYGSVGNDVFSPFDAMYNKSLPQRQADPAQAKKLLQDAGYTLPIKVELTAAPLTSYADRLNEVFVRQAAVAGFDITFRSVDSATYYGDGYGTYPLSMSYWGFLGIFDQAAFTIVKDAPYNATKWQDDEYDTLYDQAVQTVDDAKRADLVHQMQQIEYDRGAYVVAVFLNAINAYSTSLTGYSTYPNTDGGNGYHFNTIGFVS